MANYLWLWVCCVALVAGVSDAAYYGKSLGKLSEFHHGVSGHVYAVDGRTLFIKDFTYDGEGPAAFFYVGNTKAPSNNGAIRLRDERGSTGVLRRYRGKNITLTLPEGMTFHSIKWFSIWCDEFSVNFGDVKIPRNLDYPKPQKIQGLAGVHGVSSDPIVIVDAQTLLIPSFSYDGEAPDAKFWVGRGDKPSPQGIRIPDENGKEVPLRRYDHKTIVLTLPGDLTVFEIGHFGVWCEAFTVDFGHIKIPQASNVPPSLKMLGVSPQSKLNCEVLYDDLAFEVRWAVAGESIVIQLVAKLEDGEYMSFGISGDDEHTQMVGSDVTVAWVDKSTLKGYAFDYYLDAKSQCAGTRGSCPDDRLAEKTNSVRLLNAAMVNGYSIVTFQRPLKASDELDRPVLSEKSQPIVWAVGPLNSRKEVSYHSHFTKADKFLDFGRPPAWNCPMPEMDEAGGVHDAPKKKGGRPGTANNGQFLVETSPNTSNRGTNKFASDDYDSDISETTGYKEQTVRKSRPVPTPKPAPQNNAWEIPPINCYEPEDGVFYAQMGPTGGRQGYPAITGHVGWGISWYINGLLIPEINVVRGKTYTFVVEGGFDPNTPARYHPFYITDDPIGGYEHKTPEERDNVNIYAGVRQTRNGEIVPIGVGRLCNWTPDINGPGADEYTSFGAYQRSLTLQCDQGEPGVVVWTPDTNTPDTVYYQCFTHRYLGWKINVLDACENAGVASEIHETFATPDSDADADDLSDGDDLVSRPSIQVATRIKPDNNFIEQQKDILKLNDKNLDKENFNIREIAKPDDESNINIFFSNTKEPNSIPKFQHNYNPSLDNSGPQMNFQNDDRHPVYHHSTTPSQKDNGQDKPSNNNDELLKDLKNIPSHTPLSPNQQQPMTLQTFMRPHGKPMMGNNVLFRRPIHPDMRIRRPGMPKPMMGMPLRIPPAYMMGQHVNGMGGPHKKPIYKMPGMNRPPINGFGRPPLGLPVKPMMNNGQMLKNQHQNSQQLPNNPNQPIILGKPSLLSQTLTLGQPTIIGQQVVKSQMSLPTGSENIAQQSVPSIYLNKPGQIIMGKPMDNPIPLDQQMIPSKISYTSVYPSVTTSKIYTSSARLDEVRPVFEDDDGPTKRSSSVNITPSELMSSSLSPNENLVTMKPAVNTGFKPDSVVIEGGFKPIIREPLLSGEDRITDYDSKSVLTNRRSDSEDSSEEAQPEETNNQLLNNDFYDKQLTESFEPMFIPSPPDRHFLKFMNNASEKRLPEYVEIDRRPIYVYPESNSKKSQDDMAMAADRVDAYYLPPNHKSRPIERQPENIELPEGTVVSYDGHTVSDSSLTTPAQKNAGGKIYSSKLSSNSERLTKTPQFGPFKGEIPSQIQGQIGSGHVTKLHSVGNSHTFPGSFGLRPAFSSNNNTGSKITHLTLVNSFEGDGDKPSDDLEPEGSENHEETVEDMEDENDSEESERRKKRSPHHTPDHTDNPDMNESHDHDNHDHDHSKHDHDHSQHDHDHDHSQHDHSQHNHSQNSTSQSQSSDKSSATKSYTSLKYLIFAPLCVFSLTMIRV